MKHGRKHTTAKEGEAAAQESMSQHPARSFDLYFVSDNHNALSAGSAFPCSEYKFGPTAEVGGNATERHPVSRDRVPREKDYETMRRADAQVGEPAIRKVELSPEEGAIVSKYPPAAALAPEPGDIRAVADLLMTKLEDSHLVKAYFEAVEFGEYWAEVYEKLRREGIAALENYYEDSDLVLLFSNTMTYYSFHFDPVWVRLSFGGGAYDAETKPVCSRTQRRGVERTGIPCAQIYVTISRCHQGQSSSLGRPGVIE